MRKFLPILAGACLALSLVACDRQDQAADGTAEPETAAISRPAGNDTTEWKQYLVTVVQNNMQGVQTLRPFMYFVPGGDDDAALADRANQLENVEGVVLRGVLPGNMLAFGGPDSTITADMIEQAFENASANSLQGVVVLFVGDAEDEERVREAVATSGAELRFVEAK